MRKLAVLFSASFFFSACESGTTTRPRAPGELAPALDAFCGLLERCPDYYTIGARDRGECVDILYWLFTCRIVEAGGDPVGVERVELMIDGEEASACADAINGLSCEDLSCVEDGTCPELDACRGLFGRFGGDGDDDTLAEGERCYGPGSSDQCGPGLFCADEAYDPETESVVCSICARLLSAGAACDPNREDPQCAAGLGCFATDELRTDGECGPLLADGEPCLRDHECAGGFCAGVYPDLVCSSGGDIGDPCTIRSDCRVEQLGADYITCVGDTCATPLQQGDPCANDDGCRSFHCDPSDDRCGVPIGGACTGDYECREGFCNDRVCAALLANGAACTYHQQCESTWCDPSTTTCTTSPPRSGVGGPCETNDECELDLFCSGSVCYRSCGSDAECGDGAYCDFGQCTLLRDDGAPCDGDEQCRSGWCSPDAEVCGVRPGIGDPCSGFSDCYPRGYCSGGVCLERLGPDERCESLDSCLEPYLCTNGVCTLISLACEPGRLGDPCTYLRFCDDETYCDYSTITCQPRLGAGESCISTFDQCAPGFYCGASSTCDPQVAEGDACMGYENECGGGTVCVAGTCQVTMSGGPCDHSDSDCPLGSYCDDETCVPYRGVGEACDEPFRDFCQAELVCADEVCAQAPGDGEPCGGSDDECRPGFFCDVFNGHICEPRAALGAECESSPYDNCIEGTFCEYDSDLSMYVCTMGLANGEPCGSGDGSCVSGFCVEGICSARGECVTP